MAVSLMPALLSALVTQGAAALPGQSVLLGGIGPTDDPAKSALWVGIQDPKASGPDSPGEGSQTMATCGLPRSREEVGTVTCAAIGWNGDMDTDAAMADAFATFETIASLVRVDPTLGLSSGYQKVVIQVDTVTPEFAPFEGGIEVDVIFTLKYEARI